MSDIQFALLLATNVALLLAVYFLMVGIISFIYRYMITNKIIRSFHASKYVQEQLQNATYETIKQHGGRVEYRHHLLAEYTKKYLEEHYPRKKK